MKKNLNYLLAVVALLMATACSTPQLGYFQNVQSGQIQELAAPQFIKIQPGDKLSILVSSKNPELAYLFNLQVVSHYQSSSSGKGLGTGTVANYTVDSNGNIDFPVLGQMHIAGMTRSEVAQHVKNKLLLGDMIKDPTVTVDFLDMYLSVMGEVNKPGRFIIDHDKVTLLDALSQAGDLTIFGRRDNVLVMREENGKQVAYRVDLRDEKSLYGSPAFYLQQNDKIYVEPNEKKARESTAIGNDMLKPSMWISIASFTVSLLVLVFK